MGQIGEHPALLVIEDSSISAPAVAWGPDMSLEDRISEPVCRPSELWSLMMRQGGCLPPLVFVVDEDCPAQVEWW